MSSEEYKLEEISEYLDNIKKYAYKDIYNLENQVLNKNPYTSNLIKSYLFNIERKTPSLFFKIKKIVLFYIQSFIRFFIYLLTYIFFRIYFKKNSIDFDKEILLIDTFLLVDKTIKDTKYNERYFVGLVEILKKNNINYAILPRVYGIGVNPFKIISLIKVLNKKENNFIFEYELLTIKDLLLILIFILKYPFKVLKLLSPNDGQLDKIYNYELINTLPSTPLIAYTRYLLGKKISKKITFNSKVVSWLEFQNLEKTFHKAMKESNKNIKIYGCQFLIQYKNYISMHITNVDYDLKITPDIVLLNGKYNYNLSKKQSYKNGVSLRYKDIFNFDLSKKEKNSVIVLLTYEVKESIRLLHLLSYIENELYVKIHPATNIKSFKPYINDNWKFTNNNIYDLFYNAKIVFVASMSGTALEAVACGVSVIVIGSKDNLTANPLVEYGKGKIWDIAFSKDDVKKLYNNLIKYRFENIVEIREISTWYKENFFIEPTEENILRAFELDKGKEE